MRHGFLFLLAVLLAAPAVAQDDAPERPKNLILMIADGFGPSYATLAREATGEPLALDAVLVGSVGTAATDTRVTDSAAGATAYACGLKTYNGAIAVDPERRPCRTLLEEAEARGMATGLVATSRITHATPASFAAHVPQRAMEAEIAAQLAASGVEVLLGGGRPFFLPEAAGGNREDGRDLTGEMEAAGFTVAADRAGFDALAAAPAAALLADSHLDYELDRDPATQPSLAEMTAKALSLLVASEGGQEEGFFLMVEGSRIDHAGHGNDPAGVLHDVLAYDDAVQVALDFAEADGHTLVVSVADHETGGMTLGRAGIYAWNADYLNGITATFEGAGRRIATGGDPADVLRDAGIADSLTAEEVAAIAAAVATPDPYDGGAVLAALVAPRSGIGWTGSGHTGVDVGLYAAGPGAERLRGHLPNDEVGRRLFALMGFEPAVAAEPLPAVTDEGE